MLAGVCVLLIPGPIIMIHCLAGVDVAVDGLYVVGVEASNRQGYVAESQADPKVLRYVLDHGVLRWCAQLFEITCF